MTATIVDAWKEVCKIGILPQDGSLIEFAGFTEDITAMDFGEKDIEGMPLVNGGRVVKFTPMTDESITLKVYPIRADDEATDSVVQAFHKQASADTTNPILVDNTITRQKFGLILLWATTLPSTSTSQVTAGQYAYRIQAVNAYMTRYVPSFDDKTFSAEVTFKWAPFSKGGTANKREESQDNSGAQLPVGISSAVSF